MSEPIRVLHVLQRMEAGGTQSLLMNIYRNIDRTKVQFDFLVEYKEKQFYDDEIESLGGRVYRTSVREDLNVFNFYNTLRHFFANHHEYKIVHVHPFTIGYFCLRAADKAGIPVRIAHSHSNGLVRNGAYVVKRGLQKIYPWHATDLFACSEEAGTYLFRDRQFNVLNNGIDVQQFKANDTTRAMMRHELGVADDELVIGNIGRLHPSKNQKFLLHVFKALREHRSNSTLLIVGNGDLKQELKEERDALGLHENVRFLGNRSDIAKLEQAFDVLVMPSQFEGLGIVAIESQAAGIPTVASTGFPEDVEITPLLIRKELSDSPESWAEAVLKQINNPLRHTNTSQAIIDAGYDIKRIAKQMQQFYLGKYYDAELNQ